jgi:hypothetical protein
MKKIHQVCFVILYLLWPFFMHAQTKGLIIEPATGIGKSILDPNGDGYVSLSPNGFLVNDKLESEIPFIKFIVPYPEPDSDLMSGTNCGFTDFVEGADIDPGQTYLDPNNNWLFRLRLASVAPNAKSFSILIDADGKFGNTGDNADPDYTPENPGFEMEITLATNFGVYIYDLRASNGTPCSPVITYPISVHSQKSIALSTICNTTNYFLDFFISFDDITAIFGYTPHTPLRKTLISNMAAKKSSICHPSSASDIAGNPAGCLLLSNCFEEIIDNQEPCAVIDENACEVSSTCPPITSLLVAGASTVSGTSIEANGTLITLFKNNNQIAQTTVTNNTWSITGIAPVLAEGDIIYAVSKATGEVVSDYNCNKKIVTNNCINYTNINNVTITAISGNKGFTLTPDAGAWPIGTTISWFDHNFNLTAIVSGYAPDNSLIANPVTTTTANQTVEFRCKTGQCFPDGVYNFTYKTPTECESRYVQSCLYAASSGNSTTPTISTSLTPSTTSISGTAGASTAPNTTAIYLFIDNVLIDQTSLPSGNTHWTINGLDLTHLQCAKVEILASDNLKCMSSSIPSYITKVGTPPTITSDICYSNFPITSISGLSIEAPGTTISLYKTNGIRTLVGTTTVNIDGSWTITGLNLNVGDNVVATAKQTNCLQESTDSESITLQTATTNTVSITGTPILEQSIVVSGTGTTGDIITLYIDDYPLFMDEEETIPATTSVIAGLWTISGLHTKALYTGGVLTATAKSAGKCESNPSASVIIQCIPPNTNRMIEIANTSYCSEIVNGQIIVKNSEANVVYTPIKVSTQTAIGYSGLGTGSDLPLLLFSPITENPTIISVKADKLGLSSCSSIQTQNVTLSIYPLPQDKIFSPTAASLCENNSIEVTVFNSQVDIIYKLYDANTLSSMGDSIVGNNQNITFNTGKQASDITLLLSATYYGDNIQCTKTLSNSLSIDVAGSTAPPTGNNIQTFCAGSTLNDITITGNSIQWYNTTTGGTALPTNTPLIHGNTYYASQFLAGCESGDRFAVTTFLTPTITSASLATSQSICKGNNAELDIHILGGTPPYTITYSDGSSNTTIANYHSGDNFPVSPLTTTTYALLNVLDKNSCPSVLLTGNPTITVVDIPTVTVSPDSPICIGDTAQVNLLLTGTPNWSLMYFDGANYKTISGINTPSFTFDLAPIEDSTYDLIKLSDAHCTNFNP